LNRISLAFAIAPVALALSGCGGGVTGGASSADASPGDSAAHAATDAVAVDDAGDAGPGSCSLLALGPALVCFGSDPTDYAKYLVQDAGVAPGACPAAGNFIPATGGEGSCGYLACGPLSSGEVPPDAGVDSSSSGCCFWVLQICGV
jgi:hypothetical protein